MKHKIRKVLENAILEIANAYLDGVKELIKVEKEKRNQFTDFQEVK